MLTQAKVEHDLEKWESGALGSDGAHAVVADGASEALDAALGLQMLSIRLDQGLFDALKSIAAFHAIGLQPMVRDLLVRFARAELKMIVEKLAGQAMEQELRLDGEESGPAAAYFDKAA